MTGEKTHQLDLFHTIEDAIKINTIKKHLSQNKISGGLRKRYEITLKQIYKNDTKTIS